MSAMYFLLGTPRAQQGTSHLCINTLTLQGCFQYFLKSEALFRVNLMEGNGTPLLAVHGPLAKWSEALLCKFN